MLQTPQKNPAYAAHPNRSRHRYVADLMPESAMITYLAQAVTALREEAGRKRYHVAAAAVSGVDPSTLYRFERGRWPHDADQLVDLYAADLNIDPVEIWVAALKLWIAEAASEEKRGQMEQGLGEAVRALRQSKAQGGKAKRGRGRPGASGGVDA